MLPAPPGSPRRGRRAAASSCWSRKIGRQALGDDAVGGQLAGKRRGNAELFELAVQPVGELLVLVAVAEEGEIARA